MTDYEKYLGCHFPIKRPENERITHYKISGSCLEGIGVYIPHGGVAFVDKNETPRVNDLAVILRVTGALSAYIKEIESIDERGIITRTRYTDPSKDFTIRAREYLGTVLIITNEHGDVIWESKREHIPLTRCTRCRCFYKSGTPHRCKETTPYSPVCLPYYEKAFFGNARSA